MRRVVLYLCCLPPSVLGYLVLGSLMLCGLASRRVEITPGGIGMLTLWGKDGGFLERRWPFSTTLGPRTLYMHPRADVCTLAHEVQHTSQAEGVSIAWGLATLLSWSWRMAILWPFCWLIVYLGASISAWLAQRHWYRGNEYERQAYQLEDALREHVRSSWRPKA